MKACPDEVELDINNGDSSVISFQRLTSTHGWLKPLEPRFELVPIPPSNTDASGESKRFHRDPGGQWIGAMYWD